MNTKKLESTIEHPVHRSGYGDMHAHRDALMMADHVALVHGNGMIDATMAAQFVKPVHRGFKYTPEYLGTHPEYTGVQPDMTPLSTAERHQKQRDREMIKFIEDYEAGLIDDDGKPVAGEDDLDADDTSIHTSEDGSDTYDPDAFLKLDTSLYRFSDPSEELAESSTGMTVFPAHPRNAHSSSARAVASKSPSMAAPSKSPSPAASSNASEASAVSQMPATRGRKRKYRVNHLQPLPGGEDYSQYKYYQLLAVCRERQIYSAGDTQEVRNCLIQDDINIVQGLPRDIAKWKSSSYKSFKYDVPEALKRGSGKK